jgi:aspartyl-tRNA(Asn)/glutamyl-tRNA(Gln) amidotransferase subunit B
MNRCGVPLVEIVTEPDFRSAAEASAFVTAIRELLRYIGVCDGNMESGSLRCDVNISVRPTGQVTLNERTEIKNLNSIRAVERAIHSERARQIQIYESGGAIYRETLLWDESTEEVRPMRRKEGSDDYRYFPEPDLVELRTAPEFVAETQRALPELPWERRRRFREQLGLHPEAVSLLSSDRAFGDYFEELMREGVDARTAANWLQGEVRRALTERDWTVEQLPLTPRGLTELIGAVQTGVISLSKAKEVFRVMLDSGRSARQIISDEGLSQSSDSVELRKTIEQLLARFPDELGRYRAGKKNLFGFFMGEAMKAAGGNANPKVLNQLLQDMLNA